MSADLIVEDGTGIVGADSYNSVADIDEYCLNLGYTDWPQPPEDGSEDPNLEKKKAHARRATIYLDSVYGIKVNGVKKESNQGLIFPRVGATNYQGVPIPEDTVPLVYKNAQCEVALLSYKGVALTSDVSGGPQLKRKRIEGAIDKEWFEGSEYTTPVFGWLDTILTPLFGPTTDPNALQFAALERAS